MAVKVLEDPSRYGPRRRKRHTLASYPATVLVVAGIFTGKASLFGLIGLVVQNSMHGFMQRAEENKAKTTDAMTAMYNESLEMADFLGKGMVICYTISLVLVGLTVIFTIWARVWSERQKRARRKRRAQKKAAAAANSRDLMADEDGAQQQAVEGKATLLSPILSESPASSAETYVTPSEGSPLEGKSSASPDAVSAAATTPSREPTPPAAGQTPEGVSSGPEAAPVLVQEAPSPEEGTSPTAQGVPAPAEEVSLTEEEKPSPEGTPPPEIGTQPLQPSSPSEATPSATAGKPPTEEAPPLEVAQSTQQQEEAPALGANRRPTEDLPEPQVRRPSMFPDIHET